MSLVKEYTDPKTGKKYPVGGCIVPDKTEKIPLAAAPPFRPKHGRLPPSVSLRNFMTPIEHQGSSNSW